MPRLWALLLTSSLGWMATKAVPHQDAAQPYLHHDLDGYTHATSPACIIRVPVTGSEGSAGNATTTVPCAYPSPAVLTSYGSMATPTIPMIPHSHGSAGTSSPSPYYSPAVLTSYDSIATPILPWRPSGSSATAIPSTFTDGAEPDRGQRPAQPAHLPDSAPSPPAPIIIPGTTLPPGAPPAASIPETTRSASDGYFSDVISRIFGGGDEQQPTTSTGSITASIAPATSSATHHPPPEQTAAPNTGAAAPRPLTFAHRLLVPVLAALAGDMSRAVCV